MATTADHCPANDGKGFQLLGIIGCRLIHVYIDKANDAPDIGSMGHPQFARLFAAARSDANGGWRARHRDQDDHTLASPSSSQTITTGRWGHLDERARAERWIERIQSGDEGAVEQLVRVCYAPVLTFARRYVPTLELAEEVTQDVFVRLWERRDRLKITHGLMTYLFVAARHQAFNAIARLRERVEHVEVGELAGMRAKEGAPDLLHDAAELSRAFRATVDRLAPRGREVFLLSRRDGLAPAQIAAVLGVSVPTVYTLLARALQELKKNPRRAVIKIGPPPVSRV